MKTTNNRISREVDRSPLTSVGKQNLEAIKEYYRLKKEALANGTPPPEPPGIRSPLDKPSDKK